METLQLRRTFRYNSVELPDPGPQYTVEQVRDLYAATYPEIVSAAVEGPEQRDEALEYTFRRAVGTKGGSKAHPGEYDCYANAAPDEPMFILLGRDPMAPSLVELWATARAATGEDPAKVAEAQSCAVDMRDWLLRLGKAERPVALTQRESAPEPLTDQWAIVELFGHTRIAGRVSEITMAGYGFLRVDIPEIHGTPATRYQPEEPGLPSCTRILGPKSIYALTPCEETTARTVAGNVRHRPVTIYEQRAMQLPLRERDDSDDFES